MTGIYKITSPTGKLYIGQSFDINQRRLYYKYKSCKSQRRLYNSILKHSWEKHIFEIIHELPDDIDIETITTYEQLYMDSYREGGVELMNLRDAGPRGRYTKEARESRKGRPSPNKGKQFSEERKKNLRIALTGVKKTQIHKDNIIKGRNKNYEAWRNKVTEVHRKRLLNKPSPCKFERNSFLEMVEDYKNTTMTRVQIAKKYNISTNTVTRIIKELGVPFRYKGRNSSNPNVN